MNNVGLDNEAGDIRCIAVGERIPTTWEDAGGEILLKPLRSRWDR